jgi:hypothetical protein
LSTVRLRRAFVIRQIAIMAETQIAIAISPSMGRRKLYQSRVEFLVASPYRQHTSEDEMSRFKAA